MEALETLEETKETIKSAIDDYFKNQVLFYDNKNSLYRESRLIIKRLAKEMEIEVPVFIDDCRTVEEVVNNITLNMGLNDSQYTLINEVSAKFNMFIDYLEDNNMDVKIIHVKCDIPEHLTFNHIKSDLENCDKRFYAGDYPGVVTSARSLVEGVCHEILFNITGDKLEKKPDLPALFKMVRKTLNLETDNQKLKEPLRQVINGFINIVNGLAEIRNDYSDSHHRRYEVSKHHALVVSNSAKTVVTFLFHTYEYQLERGTLKKAGKNAV